MPSEPQMTAISSMAEGDIVRVRGHEVGDVFLPEEGGLDAG